MRKYHSRIALAYVQEYEEQEQRYTCDDVRVEHRDVVHEGYGLLCLASHVVQTYGCDGSENRRYRSGDNGYEKGVLDGKHKGTASLHVTGEQVGIQSGREAGPVSEDLAFCEREDCDEHDRRI